MSKNPTRIQLSLQKALLREMIVRPLEPSERTRFKELLEEHHYLGAPEKLSGEQIKYVATTPDGRWLALLAWAAAAKHLQGREDWIGWNKEQRRRRLSLVTNNARFLILPDARMPNLASRALALCLQRIRGDWQERYGHPVLVAETFVDFQEYEGTCYKASGWELVGNTQGFGRGGMDYYTRHDRPKALFLKELVPGARERLLVLVNAPADGDVASFGGDWLEARRRDAFASGSRARRAPTRPRCSSTSSRSRRSSTSRGTASGCGSSTRTRVTSGSRSSSTVASCATWPAPPACSPPSSR